jgi:hypothetical protein
MGGEVVSASPTGVALSKSGWLIGKAAHSFLKIEMSMATNRQSAV